MRKKKKLFCRIMLGILIIFELCNSIEKIYAVEKQEQVAKLKHYQIEQKVEPKTTDNLGVQMPYGEPASVFQFINSKGEINIAYCDNDNVYISALDQQCKLVRTLVIQKEMEMVGQVTMDGNDNYYIVYGQEDKSKEPQGNKCVMRVVKYNSDGFFQDSVDYTGLETCAYTGLGWGTRVPFDFGSCDVAWDRSRLIVRYGRLMYNGHQSSHTLYIDTTTMRKEFLKAAYTSHSFDQKVLVASNGDYLFADRGDGYGRGFMIEVLKSGNTSRILDFEPFHFRNSTTYQCTYSYLGGLAEISNAYILAGTADRILSYDAVQDNERTNNYKDPQDLFVQYFSKEISGKDKKLKQLLEEPLRIPTGTYDSNFELPKGIQDEGVRWLTSYEKPYYASNSKVVALDENRILLMWEEMKSVKTGWEDIFIASHYMILDREGEIIQPDTIIENTRLAYVQNLILKNNKIYWTTSHENYGYLFLHELTVGETMPSGTDKYRFDSYQLGKVNDITVKVTKDNSILLSWNKVLGAAYYDVNYYVKYKDENVHHVVSHKKNVDFKIEALDIEDYDEIESAKIQVIAINDYCESYFEAVEKENGYVLTINLPKTPTNVKVTSKKGKNLVQWSRVKNCDGYAVYRKKIGGKYKLVKKLSSKEIMWNDKNIESGKKYKYCVRAYTSCQKQKIYGRSTSSKVVQAK